MNPVAPLDFHDFRQAAHDLAVRRRQARAELERAVVAHADAECEYRKARAIAYVSVDGGTVAEREVKVDERTADLRKTRDIAKGRIDVAKELLAEIDAERASLHRLADWSARIDPAGADHQASVAQPMRRVA